MGRLLNVLPRAERRLAAGLAHTTNIAELQKADDFKSFGASRSQTGAPGSCQGRVAQILERARPGRSNVERHEIMGLFSTRAHVFSFFRIWATRPQDAPWIMARENPEFSKSKKERGGFG
jgi:hypothetical protein